MPASAVLHRSLHTTLPEVVAGEGAWLIDSVGRRYLDASGGAAVSCLGHSHPDVIAAIQAQVGRIAFAHTGFFTNAPAERLAARLIERAPAGFGTGRVAFVGSGSEAMEVALKLARQYQVERGESGRSHFIARQMSYHGNTLGALAVGGNPGRRVMYAPMLMEVSHIAPCHAYRFRAEGETEFAYGQRVANELETAILRVGPDRVAAFVAEPVVGATLGCVPAVSGYFQRIREICDQYGVLLIADEVMCGMGRTGTWFASEQEGVCPDIITVAKGLGAGYQPLGAVLARESVVAAIADGSGALANGHTYMSHAVACAAGEAVIGAVERADLLANVRRQGATLRTMLDERFAQHPHVGDIRGRGLMLAIELVEDRASKAPFPRRLRLAETIRQVAQDNGLICYPSAGSADGQSGDHVLLAPPYTVTDAELAVCVDRLSASIGQVLDRAQESI
ncbi:MAG TPA: aspartate aminotransferase family protein [Acetobacteraceae bacterium]|jgi:adenosylmethionine-8-amino-7-oxononanoate aminotransferase|nr:aspartate aminotransferase family protein [Acetobacteraceae bacterium]